MRRHALLVAGVVCATLVLSVTRLPAADTDNRQPEPQTAEALKKELDDLKKEMQRQAETLRLLRENQDLRQRLDALEKRVDALEKRSTTSARPSFYEQGSGTIRLQNRLPVSGTIVLNGISYRLAPNETRTLTGQASGAFTYEALADGMGVLQPRSTRTLLPNETYDIYLYLR